MKLSILQKVTKVALGVFLVAMGLLHLTWFEAPAWLPFSAEVVSNITGAIELLLGSLMLAMPERGPLFGVISAILFALVLPGNVSSILSSNMAFNGSIDQVRSIRILSQGLMIAWALWSTGAWGALMRRTKSKTDEFKIKAKSLKDKNAKRPNKERMGQGIHHGPHNA